MAAEKEDDGRPTSAGEYGEDWMLYDRWAKEDAAWYENQKELYGDVDKVTAATKAEMAARGVSPDSDQWKDTIARAVEDIPDYESAYKAKQQKLNSGELYENVLGNDAPVHEYTIRDQITNALRDGTGPFEGMDQKDRDAIYDKGASGEFSYEDLAGFYFDQIDPDKENLRDLSKEKLGDTFGEAEVGDIEYTFPGSGSSGSSGGFSTRGLVGGDNLDEENPWI